MHIAYRYREETGEECHGGNATVHKGEDHGRPVAVKVARIYTANDPKTSHRVRLLRLPWGGIYY